MVSKRELARRARALVRAYGHHSDAKEAMSERIEGLTPVERYVDPEFQVPTIDVIGRGILLARSLSGCALSSLRLEIAKKRFHKAYDQTHPLDLPVSTQEALAAAVAETAYPTDS